MLRILRRTLNCISLQSRQRVMKSAILLKTITEKLKTIFPCFFYGTLVCIFLCGVSCKNQGTRDNTFTGGQSAGARMVDSLNSLMWHYYLDNPDSAEIIQYRTIRVIDSLQLQQQKIYAFLRLAEFYQYRKPDYQKAIKNLKEAVSIYTGSPGPYRTNPYFFVDIGNIFFHSRMYHQALTFYHISYMTARQESNFHARALALQNIALCFSEQEQFDSALFYFNRADMAVTDRTNPILAENAADKAALFLQAGHFDSARVYAGK